MWPSLGLEVKPLLFLTPSNSSNGIDDLGNLQELSKRACARGWDILVAPHCNAFNTPMLASMFQLTQGIINATWYGYANADLLFTNTFLPQLHFLQEQNATQVDFVVGRRTNLVVC